MWIPRRDKIWSMAWGLAVLAAAPGGARACGPFFPSDMILRTDDQLRAAPLADFTVEINRLQPQAALACKAVLPAKPDQREGGVGLYGPHQTADADVNDLRAALQGTPSQALEHALWQLQAVREEILKFAAAHARWSGEEWNQDRGPEPVAPALDLAVRLKDLPAEFTIYERGALAYHSGKLAAARGCWEAVLALPPAQRHYRSTWAAYMLGRSYVPDDPKKAITYLQQARTLAAAGFADALGLSATSLGWEAQAALRQGRYEAAVELLLEQREAGDPTAGPSLRLAAQQILRQDATVLCRVAKDPAVQRVVTAFLLSLSKDDADNAANVNRAEPWLQAARAANVPALAGVERLAWAAYQVGDVKAAESWLAESPADAPVTLWLRAKLSLRAGDAVQAAALLAKAARAFPPQEQWPAATEEKDADPPFTPRDRVQGELAVLQLHRGQFVEALDLLLKAGFWRDGAYLAERVLTPDELVAYVKTLPTPFPPKPAAANKDTDTDTTAGDAPDIRYLAARRLLRQGRSAEARSWYPVKLQPRMDAYVTALHTGQDAARSAADRAQALWQAATLARWYGLALLGTEVEPDWALYGGNYELDATGTKRATSEEKINAPSAAELERLKAQPAPEHRFHYRYVACDHAWAAAALLPDESDETARILCQAGGWLKNRDPKGALRFYKALIERCGTTALGKDAKTRHWFPPEKKKDTPSNKPGAGEGEDAAPPAVAPNGV